MERKSDSPKTAKSKYGALVGTYAATLVPSTEERQAGIKTHNPVSGEKMEVKLPPRPPIMAKWANEMNEFARRSAELDKFRHA